MKRANLVLDEHFLQEAVRLSGERTYSGTVERALEEFVRRVRAGDVLKLVEVRGDRPARSRRRRGRGPR